ncbi:MAG TPA: hypothetical protein VK145_00910 [Candidatus Nanoarchaeia archaeon]|nr:hypothetical protein [Candidatus Nanoarchaeia archaeon]
MPYPSWHNEPNNVTLFSLAFVMLCNNQYVLRTPAEQYSNELHINLACPSQLTHAISNVTTCPHATDKAKNRGFAFIEYYTHKDAAKARRAMNRVGMPQIFGCNLNVDWAEIEVDIDPEVMKSVSITSIGSTVSERHRRSYCYSNIGTG